MNPEFFRIAATKTTDPVALAMLAQLQRAAQELADADASFPERINANKAKRGERPTKLPKAKKEQLGELAQDQIALDAKLCTTTAPQRGQVLQYHANPLILSSWQDPYVLNYPEACTM